MRQKLHLLLTVGLLIALLGACELYKCEREECMPPKPETELDRWYKSLEGSYNFERLLVNGIDSTFIFENDTAISSFTVRGAPNGIDGRPISLNQYKKGSSARCISDGYIKSIPGISIALSFSDTNCFFLPKPFFYFHHRLGSVDFQIDSTDGRILVLRYYKNDTNEYLLTLTKP